MLLGEKKPFLKGNCICISTCVSVFVFVFVLRNEERVAWIKKLFERATVQEDFFGPRCEPFRDESIYFCGNCFHKNL